ncbi:MAG TPA: tetratricopeptide repeat protein, partial [Myxococcota bacterium]|nr:tetratricopeptide repeat protein [Myxococcota bacterium]
MKTHSVAAVLCVQALLTTLTPSCKPKPPTVVLTNPDGTQVEPPPQAAQADEAAASAMAAEASGLQAAGKLPEAEAKRDALLKQYPNTGAAADLYEARAQAAVVAGKPAEALAWYEKLLFYRPNFPRIDEVREKYAALLAE